MHRIRIVSIAAVSMLAVAGNSQRPAASKIANPQPAQYGPAFRTLEKGKAPNMQVQILNRSGEETTYAVIFGKGDEVLAGLTEFAAKENIDAARITGIGAIENATLGWLDPQRKMYRLIPIDGQSEVLSLLGDIASFDGKPVVHAHMVAGSPDGSVRGGHLIEARVWPTLEVVVTQYPNAMPKKMDAESGMALIDPALKSSQ